MKLRNCNATVSYGRYNIVDGVTGENVTVDGYKLTSYETDVCIYDEYNDIIYLLPYWDCSHTTHSHVRKFVEDYVGIYHTAYKAREEMKLHGYYRAAHFA